MRIVALLFIAILASASNTKIFHINGINTSQREAEINFSELKHIIKYKHGDQNLTYILAYNQTDGFLSDVLDCYKQKQAEFDPDNNKSLKETNVFISEVSKGLNHLESTAMTPDEINEKDLQFIQNSIPRDFYTDADTVNIRSTILRNTEDGDNIFIVAHSQGTLYANIVYQRLAFDGICNTSNTKILSVADVANVMPNGDWLSSKLDYVVIAVKKLFGCMEYNSQNDVEWGHSLIDVYLKPGTVLLEEFKTKVAALLDTFEKKKFDGSFKFTFYGLGTVQNYAGLNIPYVTDSTGMPLWGYGAGDINITQSGTDVKYQLFLPTGKDFNGTYDLEWTFNDVGGRTGLIECGDATKTILITPMSVNHFGKLTVVKTADGYSCAFQ